MFQAHVTTLLERKVDDAEQYQRRQSLRISGIPCNENEKETGAVCLNKVITEVKKLGINTDELKFDRAHRVGRVNKDKDGKDLPQLMIVRLSTWNDRTIIYRNRDKKGNVRFFLDLTKRRYELKKKAINRVKDNPEVDFVFTDVNCNLCIRLKNGNLKFFNSEEELDNVLG